MTRPGETITHGGVTVLGPLNVPSSVPYHASQMLSSNITAFLRLLLRDGNLSIDLDDEIVRETLVTHKGAVAHPKIAELLAAAQQKGDAVSA